MTRDAASFAPDDLRRTTAAFSSAVLPGLGQLLNGRHRLARWFALPTLILLAVVTLFVATRSPARLFASVVSPSAMSALLMVNAIVLAWRVAAVLHAFFDGRYPVRAGRAGAAGLVLVLAAVVVPHGVANAWGSTAKSAFAQIFEGDGAIGPGQLVAAADRGPGNDERMNILVVGIDKTPSRSATLTDSLTVVSIDPVGDTATIVSLPRDLVRVPLVNGNLFGPKLNSLMAYADRHPEQFPEGGMRALEDAVGLLLGIEIHYYAQIDFFGFVKLVDAVGGVDITVKKSIYDENYDGLGVNPEGVRGWGVDAGPNHFTGWEALAYSRLRKADGESDFTRAARQQEVLLAIRDRIMADGGLLTNLPSLIEALGVFVITDLPTDRLPDLAAVAEDMGPDAVVRAVLKKPLIKTGGIDPVYGSIQVPDLAAILEVAKTLFPPPGEMPVPWPSPVPTTTPPASPAP
ncbi:MAG: LytR family transcriptional regulator [Chloroflexi bacterium]|nr:LytR family transcriptional regulator [Chloroflexota bacterium]